MAGGSDRLEDLLFRAYTDGMPPQLETVVAARVNAAIERRLSWNRRARFRRPHMPRRSIRASLAVSVVLLLLAVVAVTAIGQQLFPPGYYEPGGYMWRNAQQLGLTQTVNGYRVTLDSVYADVGQLALAVTVQVPGELAGSERVDPHVRVTDSAGVAWQMTTGGVDATGAVTKASLQYV